MATSGATTRNVESMARPVASISLRLRSRAFILNWFRPVCRSTLRCFLLLEVCCNRTLMRMRGRAAGDGPYEQTRKGVDDDGYNKEREADLHQSTQMKIARCLGKLVGDDRGHGAAVRQQRTVNLRSIADHHRDSHGFA